ncbi:DUF4169 family protein [Sphingomonas aracearum]|uniref:DUF4169 family protein n=1 Tax=Sphingomonas aracearum TaxID=2283317 RepID=A0A369VXU6_9SPHN|nr:DUF4169 family protein [Sphingomonas aracearum]RDE05892.1 DUF4169 family protein [Sphingomonas aracearum]
MAEIVNLRQARKRRARTEAAATADANRIAHGRSKAERQRAEAARERADALLDGAKRED